MAPTPMCVCLVVMLAHMVFLAHGQTVTCRYSDSILVGSTCFRYNPTQVTWAAGKAFCASMNGTLAMVNSSTQISTALKNMGVYNDAWIGANDIDVEGTFIWDHDKSPVGTALNGIWAFGEPSSFVPSLDCGEIYRSASTAYRAYVSDCTYQYGTLCMEMPIPTTTSTTTMTPTTSPTTTTSTSTTTPTTTTTTSTTTTTTPTTTTTTPSTTTTTTTKTTPVSTSTIQQIVSTTSTATTSTPASSSLAPETTTTIQSATPTQFTVNTTLSTAGASESPEPTTLESTTTTSQETSPPATIELKSFMQGGVEPVKVTSALYVLPVLIALFLKRDVRLLLI